MPFTPTYADEEPTRAQLDQTSGLLALEFGANWCGHCQAMSPLLEELLRSRPEINHLRIADGRGKPLGRSFRVKLWPTLVLLRDGAIVAQLVRPSAAELRRAIEEFSAG